MNGQECQNCKHWRKWENSWGRCVGRTDSLDLTRSFDGTCCHFHAPKVEPYPKPPVAQKIRQECRNCKRWRPWDDVWGRCGRRDDPITLTKFYQGDQCAHYQERPRKDQETT